MFFSNNFASRLFIKALPNLNIDSERSELNILHGKAALHKGRRSAKWQGPMTQRGETLWHRAISLHGMKPLGV